MSLALVVNLKWIWLSALVVVVLLLLMIMFKVFSRLLEGGRIEDLYRESVSSDSRNLQDRDMLRGGEEGILESSCGA